MNLPPYAEYLNTCIGHIYRMDINTASEYRRMLSELEVANACTLFSVNDIEDSTTRRQYYKSRYDTRIEVEKKYGLSPMEAFVLCDMTYHDRYLAYKDRFDILQQSTTLTDEDRKFVDIVAKVLEINNKMKQVSAGITKYNEKSYQNNTGKYENHCEPKYELTDESIEINIGKNKNPVTVYRIRALKDFNNVKAGDLGGYIESEQNLSQTGDCWIYGDAKVVGSSSVCDDAKVCDNAVAVNVKMSDQSVIDKNAVVLNAVMTKYSQVTDNAYVNRRYRAKGYAEMHGVSCIKGNAVVKATIIMRNSSCIEGDAVVNGHVLMLGSAKIAGGTFTQNMDLGSNALLQSADDYVALSEIGKHAGAFRCSDGSIKMKTSSRATTFLGLGTNSFYRLETVRERVELSRLERSLKRRLVDGLNRADLHFQKDSIQNFTDAVNALDDALNTNIEQ